MTAIVTGDADGGDVFLNRSTHNVSDVSMESEVNDFDAVPNELQIDGIDRAVVSVTNRNGGENSDGCSHGFRQNGQKKSGSQENTSGRRDFVAGCSEPAKVGINPLRRRLKTLLVEIKKKVIRCQR